MIHHCYYCGEPLLDADMVVRLGFDGATECDWYCSMEHADAAGDEAAVAMRECEPVVL